MKKILLFAALGLSVMAHAVELDYYKTLVDIQADPSKGTVQLYNYEYAADGSLYGLAMYQTASSAETGLQFAGNDYKGATATKWGSNAGELKVTNMRNSFLYKLNKDGDLLWAKADTTGDYDLAYSAINSTPFGGVIYADKFRTRKGVYMGYINVYDNAGNLLGSNSMSFTTYDSIVVDGKKIKRKEAFSWAGVEMDQDSFVYVAGLQGDTLLPVWNDSITPRKAWNTKGSLSSNCNTVILKYKLQPDQWPDLQYVGSVINNDALTYDRPTGLYYEDGKLYIAGTYGTDEESGIFAACYNAATLAREYVVYHPITGSLQFQQTKFEDGKIFVCGGLSKGSITVGAKTVATAGNNNNGFVFVMNQANGQALDADVHAAKNNALNITVAAYPTKDGFVAYNHETLNGINSALNYDKNMNLVSIDTIATGGGSSTINCVGRSADGNQTAVGLRAKTNKDFNVLGNILKPADTNWYCVLATLNTKGQIPTGIENTNISNETVKAVKVIKNGQLFIIRDGKTYNILGF